jgi:hypothetical protein
MTVGAALGPRTTGKPRTTPASDGQPTLQVNSRFRAFAQVGRSPGLSLARRKPGVQIPSPPPPQRPGHRPGGSPPPGRHRSRFPFRAANGQQPRTKRPTATRLRPRDGAKRTRARPSDYESKSLRPAGAIAARSGCSRQRGRPLSAFLTCRVTAGGMTKRMTARSCFRRSETSWCIALAVVAGLAGCWRLGRHKVLLVATNW